MSNGHQAFNTIESTQEYLTLLSEKIDEALSEAHRELSACKFAQRRERLQAWQMVHYTITKLSSHIADSRKLMSDLDSLTRILDEEDVVIASLPEPVAALVHA